MGVGYGSRWTGWPFGVVRNDAGQVVDRGGPELSDEQRQTLEERAVAWRIYNRTGDDGLLRTIGVLPPKDTEPIRGRQAKREGCAWVNAYSDMTLEGLPIIVTAWDDSEWSGVIRQVYYHGQPRLKSPRLALVVVEDWTKIAE